MLPSGEVEREVGELYEDARLQPAHRALGPLQVLELLLHNGRGPAHPSQEHSQIRWEPEIELLPRADLHHRELYTGGCGEVGASLTEDGDGRG